MRDLTLSQTNWDEIEAFETELDRAMTVQEKVSDYLELMQSMSPFFARTEHWYQSEREAALVETQRRLAQIGAFEVIHGFGSAD